DRDGHRHEPVHLPWDPMPCCARRSTRVSPGLSPHENYRGVCEGSPRRATHPNHRGTRQLIPEDPPLITAELRNASPTRVSTTREQGAATRSVAAQPTAASPPVAVTTHARRTAGHPAQDHPAHGR